MGEAHIDAFVRARRKWLKIMAAGLAATGASGCRLPGLTEKSRDSDTALEDREMTHPQPSTSSSASSRMPVLFVGHGSPMNAIEANRWSESFQELGKLIPRPKAILSVSAHWYVDGTYVTANPHPETIHDFGGFPKALYAVQYPAPGEARLAERVVTLLNGSGSAGRGGESARAVSPRLDWGLDHGTWSVLLNMRPEADIPVIQLSIDAHLAPAEHLALARGLQPLRDEGVLIMGSGNATHNLRYAFSGMARGDLTTPPWAASFDGDVMRAAEQHDGAGLIRAVSADSGRMSHPTPDHFLPLLYAFGASEPRDRASFPIDGFDLGSLSMRSILFGA